jgi:hypothetical protein
MTSGPALIASSTGMLGGLAVTSQALPNQLAIIPVNSVLQL